MFTHTALLPDAITRCLNPPGALLRRLGLLWCVGCVPSGPPASVQPPTSAPATTHRLAFQVEEEDECSQTLTSSSMRGELALELGAGGRATLRLDREERHGALSKSGGRDSWGHEREHVVWRGRATGKGDLQVELALAEQRCTWLPRYGQGLEVARPCTGFLGASRRLTLRCRSGSAVVTHGLDGHSVPPEKHAALRCIVADPDAKAAKPNVLEMLAEGGELTLPSAPLRLRHTRNGYGESRYFVDTRPAGADGDGYPADVSPDPEPTPQLCAKDLSDWTANSRSPFVPNAVATRALRPAVLAAQARLCSCARQVHERPRQVGFRLSAHPNQGQTEIHVREPVGGAMATCIGSLVATFPPFDFRGDIIVCPPRDAADAACEGSPAAFAYPLVLSLE